MKYLVMECHPSHAVVLSDDGRFLKVANMRYEVGQTVENVIEMQLPEPKSTSKIRWLAPVASLAACLVLVLTMMFFQAPYASVYVTINPEVRIDVNRRDMVVGVEGVNDDGIALLDGYEYRKKHLDTVMDELVDRAIAMGYLSDGGTVTVTLDADETWVGTHSDALNSHLNDYLTEKVSVTIEITAPAHHHGESDYGDTDYGDDPPPVSVPVASGPPTDYSDDGVTDYGDAAGEGDDVTDDGGDSDYNEDEDDDDDDDEDDDD